MDIASITQSSLDTLTTSLSKLDALLKIASQTDLTGLEAETVFHYFWVTEELLEKARKSCERLAEVVSFSLKKS